MQASYKRDWLAAGLLILILAALGYGRLLRSAEILYSPYSDIIAEHLGTKTVLYESVQEGRGIPSWREDQFSGYPALSNPQALYTYPFHFLFYLRPPAEALGPTIWLHFILAAITFYLVGAALGLGRWAKLLMAVAGLFNFKLIMAVYAGWLPHIPGIVFFPLLFAAGFYFLEQPSLKRALLFSAVCVLCLHTGHLQYFYYAALFLGAYILVKLVSWAEAGQWRTAWRTGGWFFLGVVLSVGMAVYLLLPLAGEASLISRSGADYSYFLSGHSLTASRLSTFFYPEANGTPIDGTYPQGELWEDTGYFGVIPLVLAFIGAIWGWRRFHTPYLAISLYISVLLSADTPLLRFLYAFLPGFDLFRSPNRLLFLTSFFGICLAGIGLQEIVQRLHGRRPRWLAAALAGSLLAVISGEGIFYSHRYVTTKPTQDVFPVTGSQRFLAKDKDIYRVAPIGATVNYGSSASMGLQIITGYDSFNLEHYRTLFLLSQFEPAALKRTREWMVLERVPRGDLLDILNVKYILSPRPLTGRDGQFEQIAHWKNQPVFVIYHGMHRGDVYLYRNKHFLPRAFWVSGVNEAPDELQMAQEIRGQSLDDVAIIRGSQHKSFSFTGSPKDRVLLMNASDGNLLIETVSEQRRFAVFSEVWHPGWRASIDGEPLLLHQADLALIGAWIPPGRHRIALRFQPLYWHLSLGISLVCGVIFLALTAIVWRQPRQLLSHLARYGKRRQEETHKVASC
jgi:hypothetical protein